MFATDSSIKKLLRYYLEFNFLRCAKNLVSVGRRHYKPSPNILAYIPDRISQKVELELITIIDHR